MEAEVAGLLRVFFEAGEGKRAGGVGRWSKLIDCGV